MIRIALPAHLRQLANASHEVEVEVEGIPTLGAALDALEARYPMLRGTVRDHITKERRPFIRFFVCQGDWSHEPPETPLPDEIATGAEPLRVVGAMAGG
ncbi:MAG: MoaD/ThiS family protein [Anaerolineae bacterium]|nr:MoaD/ThiS family protein [Anaerolineae bacterium]